MTAAPGRPYQATTSSALTAETAAERARRNGASPGPSNALATSKEARAAEPAPPSPVPVLKGAVKVDRFPTRCKYPFAEIAKDGGIWKLDPAEFKVSPGGVVQAARKWAQDNGLAVKAVTGDGMTYVQFSKDGD